MLRAPAQALGSHDEKAVYSAQKALAERLSFIGEQLMTSLTVIAPSPSMQDKDDDAGAEAEAQDAAIAEYSAVDVSSQREWLFLDNDDELQRQLSAADLANMCSRGAAHEYIPSPAVRCARESRVVREVELVLFCEPRRRRDGLRHRRDDVQAGRLRQPRCGVHSQAP